MLFIASTLLRGTAPSDFFSFSFFDKYSFFVKASPVAQW